MPPAHFVNAIKQPLRGLGGILIQLDTEQFIKLSNNRPDWDVTIPPEQTIGQIIEFRKQPLNTGAS